MGGLGRLVLWGLGRIGKLEFFALGWERVKGAMVVLIVGEAVYFCEGE